MRFIYFLLHYAYLIYYLSLGLLIFYGSVALLAIVSGPKGFSLSLFSLICFVVTFSIGMIFYYIYHKGIENILSPEHYIEFKAYKEEKEKEEKAKEDEKG